MVVAGTGARNLAIPASSFGHSEATTALFVKYLNKTKPRIAPRARVKTCRTQDKSLS
jgi:hypothetical protein